jgi:hypothetical protein
MMLMSWASAAELNHSAISISVAWARDVS